MVSEIGTRLIALVSAVFYRSKSTQGTHLQTVMHFMKVAELSLAFVL